MRSRLATLASIVVLGGLAWLSRFVVLDQDPIHALESPNPVHAELFQRVSQAGQGFERRLFLARKPSYPSLEAMMRRSGYKEVPLVPAIALADFAHLAALLDAKEVQALLAPEAIEERAQSVSDFAALPGSEAILEAIGSDPLGLGAAVAKKLAPPSADASVRAFARDGPFDFAAMHALHEAFERSTAHLVGSDLFAYENERAARSDIAIIGSVTTVLNLLLFWFVTRRWLFVGLLTLGSAISYLVSQLAVFAVFGGVQAVVLAYASTFLSFNNETLVHLSDGAHANQKARRLGLLSAIGTTYIGFLALLFAHSTVIRQMAIASLAGMLAFLLFLLPFLGPIVSAKLPPLKVRGKSISTMRMVTLVIVSCTTIAIVGIPSIETDIRGFRVESSRLAKEAAFFDARLARASLADLVATPAGTAPIDILRTFADQGAVDLSHHPARLWRSREAQEETLALLRREGGGALERMASALEAAGLHAPQARTFQAVEQVELLKTFSTPIRWFLAAAGTNFVVAPLAREAVISHWPSLIPISPRRYFGGVLTVLSQEMLVLFALGMAAMAIYLLALHRSLLRVGYVFTPLFLFGASFALYARVSGIALNLMHVMGFSLVIGLALDYTSIAASSGHSPKELSKVALTGASTLITFGALSFAQSPVLKDLGITVTLGCGIALLFALFFRPKAPE